MHTLDFLGGTSIGLAAQQLCEAAAEHGGARGTFNDIELVATADSTPEAIADFYMEQSAARAAAYRKSPEGIRAAQEADARRAADQQKHDSLMRRLPSLNMKDDIAVLDWLCEMQGPSDHSGVIVRRQTIVEDFEKAGYVAGANCGENYKPGDRDNMFRYLVGQALSGLKEGPSIHPIIHKFSDEWRAEFAPFTPSSAMCRPNEEAK